MSYYFFSFIFINFFHNVNLISPNCKLINIIINKTLFNFYLTLAIKFLSFVLNIFLIKKSSMKLPIFGSSLYCTALISIELLAE